ncbi:MAG TPA: hypothetical protein PKY05_08520, partial [Fibrobacteria bacterium]|nr:hypothetical protein [Fibrobacteria bacterium]
MSIPSGQDVGVDRPVALGRRSRLEGRLVGVPVGTVVHLAGLGRRAVLDSGYRVSFAGLPSGPLFLRCANASWKVEAPAGETLRVSMDTAQGGVFVGDPAKSLLHVANLLPATGPDALLALEVRLPQSFAGSIGRLKLSSGTPGRGQDLPLLVTGWDPLSGKARLWTRTPADFAGGALDLTLDTLRSGEVVANPFQGRGMATTVFFSGTPTKSGTLDAWPNHSQPGRNLAVT